MPLLTSSRIGIFLSLGFDCVAEDLEFADSKFMTLSLLRSMLSNAVMLTFNSLRSCATLVAVTILAQALDPAVILDVLENEN